VVREEAEEEGDCRFEISDLREADSGIDAGWQRGGDGLGECEYEEVAEWRSGKGRDGVIGRWGDGMGGIDEGLCVEGPCITFAAAL
jgi:hypothetical protein